MSHKYLPHDKHSLMNLVNYMSTFTSEATFKGFIPVKDIFDCVFVDGNYYMAIHIFDEPYKEIRSDDYEKEQKYLDKGYYTLVVIYGADNSSYMKRFKDKKYALKWIEKTQLLVRDDSWLWYNS